MEWLGIETKLTVNSACYNEYCIFQVIVGQKRGNQNKTNLSNQIQTKNFTKIVVICIQLKEKFAA